MLEPVPKEGCLTYESLTLVCVGISPDRQGKPNSFSVDRDREFWATARNRSRSKGITGPVAPEWPVPFKRNERSRWSGIRKRAAIVLDCAQGQAGREVATRYGQSTPITAQAGGGTPA